VEEDNEAVRFAASNCVGGAVKLEGNDQATRAPNFLIGGCAASGTSFLSSIMVQHPRIYLPKEMRPEPHFFYKSWEYERGWSYYLGRWFEGIPDSVLAVGERSSSYLYGGRVTAQLIARHVPEMKLVFVLRNPIERTWANYRYTMLEGLEDLSFMEALQQEQTRIQSSSGIWAEIQPYDYTGRGFYGRQLEEFLEYFRRDQMHVMKSEDLSRDTNGQLEPLLRFLGIPEEPWRYQTPPNFTSLGVVDPIKQVDLRRRLGDRFDEFVEAIRKSGLSAEVGASDSDLLLMAELRANLHGTKTEMPSDARAYLQDLFRDDIRVLERHVDFPVDDWM